MNTELKWAIALCFDVAFILVSLLYGWIISFLIFMAIGLGLSAFAIIDTTPMPKPTEKTDYDHLIIE